MSKENTVTRDSSALAKPDVDFVFVGSTRGILYVDKLFRDGRRLTGTFVGDDWVEEPQREGGRRGAADLSA
jgi:hypothetical protein